MTHEKMQQLLTAIRDARWRDEQVDALAAVSRWLVPNEGGGEVMRMSEAGFRRVVLALLCAAFAELAITRRWSA